MADEKLVRLESFRDLIKAAEQGATIPPVSRHDISRVHEIHKDIAKRAIQVKTELCLLI